MTGKGKTEKEWYSELLKRSTTGLEQYEEYKPALEKFDEVLEQMFPDQIRELEKVFAKVMENEGKQK